MKVISFRGYEGLNMVRSSSGACANVVCRFSLRLV